jgi:hypothetical protein
MRLSADDHIAEGRKCLKSQHKTNWMVKFACGRQWLGK